MSTYLLAFSVNNFAYQEGLTDNNVKVIISTRNEGSDKEDFGVDGAIKGTISTSKAYCQVNLIVSMNVSHLAEEPRTCRAVKASMCELISPDECTV